MIESRFIMKATIGTALVSWLLFLSFQHNEDNRVVTGDSSYELEESAAFSAIRDQLTALAQSVEVLSHSVNARADLASDGPFLARFNELEERLAELEQEVSKRTAGDHEPVDQRSVAEVLSQVRPIEEYRPSKGGETAFEVDEGKPLGGYSDAIYDSFHELADVVELHDFQCKQSICKITYSGGDTQYDRFAESEDPGALLIDNLSDKLGGSGLDIRFAREADGNQIMYVQLR